MGEILLMQFNDWLKNISNTYFVEVQEKNGKNHFESKIVYFIDPNKKGLSFRISLNDTNEPSTFTTEEFQFERFNIAEYVDSTDILQAGQQCLSGHLCFRKTLLSKRVKLEFKLKSFKGRSRPVFKDPKAIEEYKQGYSKKPIVN